MAAIAVIANVPYSITFTMTPKPLPGAPSVIRDVASHDSWRRAAAILTTLADPLGHTTRRTYDDLNRLVILADSLQALTSFICDRTGNLVTA
jgi:hypothetical protein